jgi:glutathionyl-hydroquinone reductase
MRELYQIPGIKSTVHWDHLRLSLKNRKPGSADLPGPHLDFEAPHDRSRL